MPALGLAELPVLAAPMAGGPSTPDLVAATAAAGSLGFLPAGYRTAEQLATDLAAVRATTSSYGVNLFVPDPTPIDREAVLAYREAIAPEVERLGAELGPLLWVDDDDWPAKLDLLAELLTKHRGERTLIFTADNATVYRIARQFLVPAITHQTKTKERRAILQRFHAGEYTVLVTSQVLNEGVDVPAAGLGIVLSGTGSVREHVQRLGRLLRKYEGKHAVLYEVVARGTAEEFTSDRRRQHHAYR